MSAIPTGPASSTFTGNRGPKLKFSVVENCPAIVVAILFLLAWDAGVRVTGSTSSPNHSKSSVASFSSFRRALVEICVAHFTA